MNTSVETITVKVQRKALDLITSNTTSNTNSSQTSTTTTVIKTDQSKSNTTNNNNNQNNKHKTHIIQKSASVAGNSISPNTQIILKDQMTSSLPIFKPEALLSSDHSLVAVYCFVKNFIG